jgi:hypothetical protein
MSCMLLCCSSGTWEPYAPDAADFPAEVIGQPYHPPFSEELWLDIRSPIVRDLMIKVGPQGCFFGLSVVSWCSMPAESNLRACFC